MKTKKSYGCKDSYMVLAAEIIAESLKANLKTIGFIRKHWTENYTDNLILRTKFAFSTYLNNEPQSNLRNATANLKLIIDEALKNIVFFKTQVGIDFKNDKLQKDEIFEKLGFNKYYKKASLRNQNALLFLLQTFKVNCNEKIREQLLAKGFYANDIDKIIDLADKLKEINMQQENLKISKKHFSEIKRNELNALCEEIKGICKLASLKITNNTALKDEFNFHKVIAKVAKTHKVKSENVDAKTTNDNKDRA